ncbi:MAG: 16S rRNA (cytosine(967)-C(5))-methyltransferase RsmB [Ferrovum sp.]|jgi:16S rRNA (cytosine967-C5)-methyltransferase|uniref:16S rRNA (cytosine(967)-C(5))-methyltransferase RsmB n=1 Tax=Ferrovum sp. TaxID=2609467 RepID=UPI00260A2CEF|nr:16S rRNA (cytosine(967)-C(5))-methyltransferase RsmB [Ferrovum sp.]MBW8065832.1 16S rRNA (cytosine(967)-C(5))-methyltransferase RsmB [Ferrovum sp.]
MIEIQRLSVFALSQVLAGKNLDHALTEARKAAKGVLSDHQRASLQDCAYGVLRFKTELELVLAPLFQKGEPETAARLLLMVAAYQLLHTRTAPHAVVSHAVETAGALGLTAARGFVNGVLRNLLRQKEALMAEAHESLEGRYSHPDWWITRLQQDHPVHWESMLQQAQQRPPMTLRVNRRFNSVAQYQARLQEVGLISRAIGQEGLVLETPQAVTQLPGFEQGAVSVQDAGAQWAAHFMGLHSGQRVLDACAAPGGKTAHMLERGNGLAGVLALDIEPGRVKKMQADLQRLHLTAEVRCADAARTDLWWDGQPFDRILLDAPCSGSGVVRRHPDIKWLRREEDIPALARRQLNLLTRLWTTLKKGGRLVYATCSLFHEENGAVIQRFLEETEGAREGTLRLNDEAMQKVGEMDPVPRWENGQLLPDDIHDGFFYAVLQKF